MRWPSNRKRTAPGWRDLREQNALKICGGRREDDVSGRVRREGVRGFARRTRHAGDGSARAARGERAYLLELGRVPDLEVHLGVVLRRIGTGQAVRGTPRQGGLQRKNRRESDLTARAVTRDNGLATYLILNLQVDVVSLVVSLLFLFLGHGCFRFGAWRASKSTGANRGSPRRLPAVASAGSRKKSEPKKLPRASRATATWSATLGLGRRTRATVSSQRAARHARTRARARPHPSRSKLERAFSPDRRRAARRGGQP